MGSWGDFLIIQSRASAATEKYVIKMNQRDINEPSAADGKQLPQRHMTSMHLMFGHTQKQLHWWLTSAVLVV